MKMMTALALVALSAGWTAAQDRMADTLRKAVVEEESQHDLGAAVQDYQRVVAQFDEERKSAATALFRLAECYRKQAKLQEARTLYERVVREFADQGNVAERSRAVLAQTYRVVDFAKPAVAMKVVNPQEARQRYRALLLEQIDLVNKRLKAVDQQIGLGVVGPSDRYLVEQEKIKLEQDLAGFDMGIIPNRQK